MNGDKACKKTVNPATGRAVEPTSPAHRAGSRGPAYGPHPPR
ncbi:hypothetical protein EIP75_08185 [Aquabacterium soli]|uniref:2-cysteine adaptor domain-containing protein n=1 Tax=Aquabacterium soli TaxID=2493092 RepID=A0A3R8YPI2_9BURK|nr:hypothetical protein EIP75_08185 [Aquabacterium soli]